MNPAESKHIVLYLALEELDFIRHVTVVRMAFLLRDDQVGHNEVALLLFPGKDRARLELVGSVCAGTGDEILYKLDRTDYRPQRSSC